MTIKETPLPRVYRQVSIAGYEKGMSREAVTGVMHMLLEKGHDWADKERVVIFSSGHKESF